MGGKCFTGAGGFGKAGCKRKQTRKKKKKPQRTEKNREKVLKKKNSEWPLQGLIYLYSCINYCQFNVPLISFNKPNKTVFITDTCNLSMIQSVLNRICLKDIMYLSISKSIISLVLNSGFPDLNQICNIRFTQ